MLGQRYWVSAMGGSWSNAANWSTTSGGPGGAGAPAGTAAVFDGGGNGNCTIDAAVNVTGFSVTAAFTGSILQGNNTIYISGNSSFAGGLFVGGMATITNLGTFNITGTNFTAPTSSLFIANTITYSSGNFSHNNGTVVLYNTSFSINGAPNFYHLRLNSTSNVITANNSFTVSGNLTFNGTTGVAGDLTIAPTETITVLGNVSITGTGIVRVYNGTIACQGDILITNTHTTGGGTGTFLINGAANQLLSNSGTLAQGRLPSVVINKPSGTLSLSGMITTNGPNWTYIAGTLSPGTSTVNFSKLSGGFNITVSGTHTLNTGIFSSSYGNITINNNLTFSNHLTVDGASASNDVNINSTLTVFGTLYMTGTQNIKYNTGLLDAKGDIINTNTAPVGGGTGTVSITGTGNQLWSCSGWDGEGTFPNILINKPSGTLSLSGVISSLGPNWTYSAATIAPGTSTICVYDQGSNPIKMNGGPYTINDIIIYPFYSNNVVNSNLTVNNMVIDGSTDHDLTLNSTVTVNGKLTINGSGSVRLMTGIMYAKGNILTTNTSNTSGGTATLIINGTSNQTITGTGTATQSRLPNTVIINKPTGSVYIGGGVPFYFYGAVNFLQGLLYSTSTQLCYFYSGSSANSANAGSYVDGPVRKRGNTAFNFPTGKSGWYAPIRISAPTTVSHVFTAEYYNTNPNPLYNITLKDPTLFNISICEYWILDRTTGTSNVSVTPSWDVRSCGIGSMPDLRVARWNGSMWKDHGNGGTSGTLAAGTITTSGAVTAFSPFTLASATSLNPLPIGLNHFKGECLNKNVKLSWSGSTVDIKNFTVEKSNDAFEWNNLGVIDTKSNSKEQDYSFEDNTANTNTPPAYYRLKLTTSFNNYFYSDVVTPKNCIKTASEEIIVSYGSLPGTFNISSIKEIGEVVVYDATGKLLLKTNCSSQTTEIDLSNYPGGLYLLKFPETKYLRKVIK
jgi:hypothetical protein